MEESTTNSFAITLVYYYNYCRGKLTQEDLSKIKKKYERRQPQLLIDLHKKYLFTMPEKVTIGQVQRVIAQFDIPSDYLQVAGLSSLSTEIDTYYDPRMDIASDLFDANYVFEQKKLFASFKKCPIEDNITKVRKYVLPLLPEEERGNQPPNAINNAATISKTAARRALILAAKEKEKEERRPYFDRLADASVPKYTFRNDLGVETVLSSPLVFLHEAMLKKERVRIIVRRRAALRGSLDAYILGFDRYWNMFLSDVDEEFICNKVKFLDLTNYRKCVLSENVLS